MRATNSVGYRLAIVAGLIVGTVGHTTNASAQDSSLIDHGRKMVRVTLALPQRDPSGPPVVKRVRGREKNDLIVLRNEGLTPEMVATSVASLSAAIQVEGIDAPRDALVRVRQSSGTSLDERNRLHYAVLIQHLRNAPLREVPGLGKARTYDFFVIVDKKR